MNPSAAPRWPFMATAQPPAPAGQSNDAASPVAWVERCAARLSDLVQDEGVSAADLRAVAAAMVEEAAYSALAPEAAAELHARREA
jgi:hypothetical protein